MSDISMDFLSLSHRCYSSQNVASSEEQGEMAVTAASNFPATNFIYLATRNFSKIPTSFSDFLACVSKHFQN